MRILVVEDDETLSSLMQEYLNKNGIETDVALEGDTGLYYAEKQIYDVLILDRMLPECDGIQILKKLREKQIATPVIFVTALNQLNDRIEGFSSGADDYLAKPFALEELLARVQALARRTPEITYTQHLSYNDLILNTTSNRLQYKENSCVLSKKESSLMELFLRNKEQTITRELIMDRIWGPDSYTRNANLDNYISFLRRRLRTIDSPYSIITVHSVGYRLTNSKD